MLSVRLTEMFISAELRLKSSIFLARIFVFLYFCKSEVRQNVASLLFPKKGRTYVSSVYIFVFSAVMKFHNNSETTRINKILFTDIKSRRINYFF